MSLGLVQAGCPGLGELQRQGTGRIVVSYITLDGFSECSRDIVAAAAAYWEQVLVLDDRVVSDSLDPNASLTGWPGADATGSGPALGMAEGIPIPTQRPFGHINVRSTYPLWAGPNRFYETMRHELAHVLGIGVGAAWDYRLRNPYRGQPGEPPDTYFDGDMAYRAFTALGGGEHYETRGVPVQNGGSGLGGNPNSHWRASVIGHELMALCSSDPSDYCPASAITLGALADMGWTVKMEMAESGARIGR